MAKYAKIFEEEVSDPIFTQHTGDTPISEADVKYLMEIGIHRARKKILKDINELLEK